MCGSIVATMRERGERTGCLVVSDFCGLRKGMCLGGMMRWVSVSPGGRWLIGRRLVISEEIGSRGIRRAADLYSLCKVVLMGGTYVMIWSASSGESQKALVI